MMGERENTELVRQIYEAFGRGDVPAILDALAEDVDWWFHGPATIPFGGRRRGRDQVAQLFAAIAEHVEIDEFGAQEFVASGERVIVLGHERVRAKSTGAAWETDWVHVWTIHRDKVAQVHEFYDTAAIVDAFLLTEPMV
jgi:ketosteroid isomerase-like protein